MKAETRDELRNARYELHDDKWIDWLFDAERAKCSHPKLECDSEIGPDSGAEDVWCRVCRWGQSIVWY